MLLLVIMGFQTICIYIFIIIKDLFFFCKQQQKLAALSKRKLPEDFLEAVADTAEEKKQKKNQNEAGKLTVPCVIR